MITRVETITCDGDGCGRTWSITAHHIHVSKVDEAAREGWTFRAHGCDFCPACSADLDTADAPVVTEAR